MARNFKIENQEFYHVYNRGTDKRKVFLNNNERDRFMKLLFLCNNNSPTRWRDVDPEKTLDDLTKERTEKIVSIGSYCLMPNHFHILITQKEDGGISKFMQKLTTAYTNYFNSKHDRTGALFEGTFKARHVHDDAYLEYLFAYIHLNPVKMIEPKWKESGIKNPALAEQYLEKYAYSSFLDHIGVKRGANHILSLDSYPNYFQTSADFRKYVNGWLRYSKYDTDKTLMK